MYSASIFHKIVNRPTRIAFNLFAVGAGRKVDTRSSESISDTRSESSTAARACVPSCFAWSASDPLIIDILWFNLIRSDRMSVLVESFIEYYYSPIYMFSGHVHVHVIVTRVSNYAGYSTS